MKKILTISAASMALFAGHAMAADAIVPVQPTAPAPVVDSSSVWEGFYAGLNAGYGWGEGSLEVTGLGSVTDDIDGWLAGGQIGYNFDAGGFILGVETDFQLADINYNETFGGITATAGV